MRKLLNVLEVADSVCVCVCVREIVGRVGE